MAVQCGAVQACADGRADGLRAETHMVGAALGRAAAARGMAGEGWGLAAPVKAAAARARAAAPVCTGSMGSSGAIGHS